MTRSVRLSFTIAMVSLLLGILVGSADATSRSSDSSVDRQLARLRRATAQFHSVSAAESAGYVGTNQQCVEAPDLGAMGIHYVNAVLAHDPAIDLEQPEMLLYLPSGNDLKLVGVEYFKVDADQDLSTDADRPVLFARGFDGPMLGHAPGMPIHYDLHVWVWARNPSGVFAQFNPNLHCSNE